MDIKRRRDILFPIIVGFGLSVLVIFIFAKRVPRVSLQKNEELELNNSAEIYYSDINDNGNTEKIHYYHYDKVFQPTLYIYDSFDNFKALWNFSEAPLNDYNVYFEDFNSDGIKETFVFTHNQDSIYLYVLDNEKGGDFVKSRLFVAKIENDSIDFNIDQIGFCDLNSDKNKEFIFYINTGIPLLSSNIFSYDIVNDSLCKSVDIHAQITKPFILDDLNLDNNPEIYISTKSVNIRGNSAQSQFIAFNHNLEYLFRPISFVGNSSNVTVAKLQSNNENRIAVLNSSVVDNISFNNLMLYNSNGIKLEEKLIKHNNKLRIINYDNNELLVFSGYEFLKFNNNLIKESDYKFSRKLSAELIFIDDIDGDNKKEFILKNNKALFILDENFTNQIRINIQENGNTNSVVYREGGKAKGFALQIDNKWYMLEYIKNETFFNSYLFYISVFIIIILSVVFLLNFVSKRIDIRKILFAQSNEEELYKELEKNLEVGITGVRSNLYQVANEDNVNVESEKINKYTEQLKKISKNRPSEFEKNIKNIIETIELTIKKIRFFPSDGWEKLNEKLREDLLSIIKEQLVRIKKHINSDNDVNIQIIKHKDYINILIEVDNILLEKEILEPNDLLEKSIEEKKGSIEIIHFAEIQTIINTIIPLKNKDQDKSVNKDHIRIIIAEDHDVSLFGLMSLFKTKKDIEVVGMAKNGMEVLKMLETKETDIIITDISMPGMDGIELSEKIKANYPHIKVIVFTMYLENWFIEQLINNGAMGFVSKNSKIIELVGAVRNVYEGTNYYCPQFKSKFGFNGKNNESKLDSLTKNEHKIMQCFANNMSKKQIAKELLVSQESLESLVANILLKLNAGDEDEIVRIAKKQKYILE
ncbi:MAG: response regulator transcription factor [Bacteroidales bacterium]|nr:response regulator transcription factor [Bacteroidales bacterium]